MYMPMPVKEKAAHNAMEKLVDPPFQFSSIPESLLRKKMLKEYTAVHHSVGCIMFKKILQHSVLYLRIFQVS